MRNGSTDRRRPGGWREISSAIHRRKERPTYGWVQFFVMGQSAACLVTSSIARSVALSVPIQLLVDDLTEQHDNEKQRSRCAYSVS